MADSLEQLWISYNSVEKLKGIAVLKKLKVYFVQSSELVSIYLLFPCATG